jgi:protein SCO1/2
VTNMRKKPYFYLFTFLILLLIATFGYWYYKKTQAEALPMLYKAPNFTLQNTAGQDVNFYDLGGKVRLVEFFYANCPDICPVTTQNMSTIQNQLKEKKRFGSDVQFVSITFDPERDTPEVLNAYAKRLKVDPSGWHILTGTPENTQKTATDFGAFVEKQADGTFVHSITSLFLVDRDNNIRKVYPMGDQMPTDEILADILQVAKE